MKKNVIYAQMMNRFLIGLVLMLIGLAECTAQNRMSYHGYVGTTYLNDQSAHIIDSRFSYPTLKASYWFNELFSLGTSFTYGQWEVKGINDIENNTKFWSAHIPISIDGLRLLNIDSNRFALILSGGPGMSRIGQDNNKEYVPSVMGSVENLFYVSKKSLAVSISFSAIGNISQVTTFDGKNPTTAEGLTSVVSTANIGLVWKPRWVKEKNTPPDTIINNYNTTNVNNHITETITPNIIEFIFFDHDKYVVRDSELNALYQIYTSLKENDGTTVHLISYASPTKSSDKYNYILAKNRNNAIVKKLVELGVPMERIKLEPIGKDNSKTDINHDLARRVELKIIQD